MEKTELTRHTLVFLTARGKENLKAEFNTMYCGEEADRLHDVFDDAADVPGIVRRAEPRADHIAVGFVPWRRLSNGNRLRIAAYIPITAIQGVTSVYVLARNGFPIRSRCMEAAMKVSSLAMHFELQAGFLGSAGLEIATGLPYTDDISDLDILLKPAPYDRLVAFYCQARDICPGIDMDFEVEFPNGYGVKLAELCMDTCTVLGKSLKNVKLLDKKSMMVFLQ